ncbi:MAG TPA: EAL domain-containing protein, partial [Gemmatimonadales bacterium]|nr:EAL domain-containing protein [Gemmatimonadales bacterium]
ELMSRTSASGPAQRWQEILRRVAIALKGRDVGVCEADSRGRMHLLAASSAENLESVAIDEVEATLRGLGELRASRKSRLWVAGRLSPQHWCVTPVWSALPQPPPAGVERRSPERLTLELGGVCIGLIEAPDREAAGSRGAGDQALLASIAEQVPAILWTTDAALRVTSRSGAGPKSLALLPTRIVGASLLEQYDRGELPAESVEAHRQALAGNSISYQIRLGERYYDAHVKPLLNEAGAIVGVVGLALDVSDRERALVQARRSQLELEDFVEHTPVGIRWTGPDGTILRANQAELEMLGYRSEEYVGKNVATFHVDAEVAADTLRRLQAGEAVPNVETRLRRRDGSICYGLVSASARFDHGEFVHARCLTRDITQRKLQELALAQFKAMVESADDAVIGKTVDGIITSWNAAATELYGYAAEEAIGKPITLLAPPERSDEFRGILERLRRGERVEREETTRVRKDGTRVEVAFAVSPILDVDGRVIGATSIAHDITERKRIEQQLLHAALHDALTDLPNRAYLVERVSQAQARVRRDPNYRFAVLFIDSDNFKAVNDSFGHAAGDGLLREIAGRLRTCVRPADVVARLGGDEFAVLLEEIVGRPDAEHAARRIQDALATPASFEGRDIVATASIGVAVSQPGYKESQDLLHDADLAMYHAKQQGGARFQVFDVTMRESAQARASIEADLRNALDRQEFRLVFHPIVELHTGRVHGFEALLRWHHPERGVIPPLEFVPLAEETGVILPIGNWVISEACRYGRRWQDAFPAAGPLRISVNVSPKQLEREGLVDEVRTALQEAGLAPSRLILEITESMLMKNVESSTALLRQLRTLGVELHMDDFGTGYSSLGQLPHLPIQGIKIHHMFVHRMGGRRTDLEIVRSVVELARTLGLGVIAEGVDTVAQRERLIGLGCEFGQGSLFAEPLEPAAASVFLASQCGEGSTLDDKTP